MAGMMLSAGLTLPVCAATGRPQPVTIINETETQDTETDIAEGKNHSYSVNHGYSSGFGTAGERNPNAPGNQDYSNGYSYGYSYNTSASSGDNDAEADDITFGWFDTEGFHVATSENLDRMDADNDGERSLAEDTGRVYGWLDASGFHPIEDMFNGDGTASEEMRRKTDEFRENYDHVKSVIDDVKNNLDESEIADELEEAVEDAGYEDEEDEEYDDDEDTESGEYDDEEDEYYSDDEDEFTDDDEEDFYSDSLVNMIGSSVNGQIEEETDGTDAQELIEGRKPSYIIVEEDVFESKNTARNNSKGTVSGREESSFDGEGARGVSESDSYSTAFGTGESEGTGVVKGRRYYYIYDLTDDSE